MTGELSRVLDTEIWPQVQGQGQEGRGAGEGGAELLGRQGEGGAKEGGAGWGAEEGGEERPGEGEEIGGGSSVTRTLLLQVAPSVWDSVWSTRKVEPGFDFKRRGFASFR